MEYSHESGDLTDYQWDVGFVGSEIDERGNESVKYIKNKAKELYFVSYDPNEYVININANTINIDDVDDFFVDTFKPGSKFVLDCTTLGVPELLILLQSIKNKSFERFEALYLEPYKYKMKESKFISKRDFELTEGFNGYIAIPGHALSISTENNDKTVFCCGYEAERIERAFEDLNLNSNRSNLLFGIPAFHAGWEINSFSNNINTIDNLNLNRNFYFCGASNPLAVYEQINVIYKGLNDNENLFIVPTGTKPMALGACIFKVVTNDSNRVAILYDHPIKKRGRTSKISRWNLYSIVL